MDNSLSQGPGSTARRQPRGLLARLRILDSLLVWLAEILRLTEEEQNEAGIYLGDRRYR